MPDLNEDEPVDDEQPPTQLSTRGGPLHLAETDDRLMWVLHVAANEWGAQGVALTAALMADPNAVVRSLIVAGSARPFGPKMLRRAIGGFPVPRPGEDPIVASMRGRRDRARQHAVRNEQERDEAIRERDEARQALVDHAREAEQLAEGLRSTIDNLRDLLDAERARAERAEGLVEYESLDQIGTVTAPDGEVDRVRRDPGPLDADPRRPRLDHFPTDALTLTYREVRQLLALHVEAVGESVLSADEQARAMRDGETPLRLAEVLDR